MTLRRLLDEVFALAFEAAYTMARRNSLRPGFCQSRGRETRAMGLCTHRILRLAAGSWIILPSHPWGSFVQSKLKQTGAVSNSLLSSYMYLQARASKGQRRQRKHSTYQISECVYSASFSESRDPLGHSMRRAAFL